MTLKKNIILSFLFKAVSVISNFLIVSLSLKILDKDGYGIWLTISAFVSWFSFFDFGLTNGLKNKLTELFALKKYKLSRLYISSSFFFYILIILLVTFPFFIISFFLNWNQFFHTGIDKYRIIAMVDISLLFFALKMLSDIILVIKSAEQNVAFSGLIYAISNLLVLVSLALIYYLKLPSNLLLFSIICSALPFLITFIYSFIQFSTQYRFIQPSWKYVHFNLTKDIFGVSLSFFIIQIAGVIIFSTDNLIIVRLFGPAEVTNYNIAYKYFGIITMIEFMLLTPFWPAITKHYVLQDLDWIKKRVNQFIGIWVLLVLMGIGMLFCAPYIYTIWLGKEIYIPLSLNMAMLISFSISSWNMIFATFVNSIAKIRLQLYSSLAAGILNIPVAIFLAGNLGWGPKGVIWSTTICLFISSVWSPIQYYKIINKKAKGIWNR